MSGASGLLGASFASLLIFLIWVGATVIAVLPAVGNPDQSQLKTWATGWLIAGFVGVALVGCLAWAIAPPARRSAFALGVDVLAVGAAIAAALVQLAYAYHADADSIDQQTSALVFLLVLGLFIAGPLAAWWVALRTRSSGRSLVAVASATGIISLVTNLVLVLRG
jgi:hypothetical protein